MAEPIRFFDILRSTNAEVEVLRTDLTTWAGMMASATTDLPRPSTQFTAAGFLSVQKLPEEEIQPRYRRDVGYLAFPHQNLVMRQVAN